MDKTKTGTKNIGFTIAIIMIIPAILRIICAASNTTLGKISSTALEQKNIMVIRGDSVGLKSKTHPISFENRFNIRPLGFVSKKRIGVEIIPWNMPL